MFRQLIAAAAIGIACSSAFAAGDTPRAQCDALAAAPFDDTRPAGVAGVLFDDIDTAAAIAACTAAVEAEPEDGRLKFQLGRAHHKAGAVLPARTQYLEAAQLGNALAMRAIGVMYDEGEGYESDPAKALEWFQMAFDAGSIDAAIDLGYAYAVGRGTTQDLQKARLLLDRAAAMGKPDAMYWRGQVSERQTPPDRPEAYGWYRKAAEAGDGMAMLALAGAYERGVSGVIESDDAQAVAWFEKAAEAGEREAMEKLVLIYADGTLAPADPAKAADWERRLDADRP